MSPKLQIFLFLVLFFIGLQADHGPEHSKQCNEKVNPDQATTNKLKPGNNQIPEGDPKIEELFACYYEDFINDQNQLIADDKYHEFLTDVLLSRVQGRRKLAGLIAKDCIERCKDVKGDNKGSSAIKVINCVKTIFYGYIEENNP